MWWLRSLSPSPREWLAAIILFLSVPVGADYLRALFPPAPPMSATVLSDGYQTDGTWRVERTMTRTVACRTVVYDRRFDGETNGGPIGELRMPAVASSMGVIEDVSVVKNAKPTTNTHWWAYRLPDGFRGLYTVRVGVSGCENGFEGWFVLYTATVP
jgi:hypothetical protein